MYVWHALRNANSARVKDSGRRRVADVIWSRRSEMTVLGNTDCLMGAAIIAA